MFNVHYLIVIQIRIEKSALISPVTNCRSWSHMSYSPNPSSVCPFIIHPLLLLFRSTWMRFAFVQNLNGLPMFINRLWSTSNHRPCLQAQTGCMLWPTTARPKAIKIVYCHPFGTGLMKLINKCYIIGGKDNC